MFDLQSLPLVGCWRSMAFICAVEIVGTLIAGVRVMFALHRYRSYCDVIGTDVTSIVGATAGSRKTLINSGFIAYKQDANSTCVTFHKEGVNRVCDLRMCYYAYIPVVFVVTAATRHSLRPHLNFE